MTFEETMDNIAKAFEGVGVGVIVVGGLVALVIGLKDFRHMNNFFSDVRRDFGRPLILGIEILVAVRIALSFSLDIEFYGKLPWRRVETEARLKAAGESDPD